MVDTWTGLVETDPVSMNIKHPEAHAMARQLAELEHTTVTEAVTVSLREALARRRASEVTEGRLTRMRELADRFDAELSAHPGPSLWDVSEDLYDERGLPR